MGKIRLPFIDSDLLYIEVSFKAVLTVYCIYRQKATMTTHPYNKITLNIMWFV